MVATTVHAQSVVVRSYNMLPKFINYSCCYPAKTPQSGEVDELRNPMKHEGKLHIEVFGNDFKPAGKMLLTPAAYS